MNTPPLNRPTTAGMPLPSATDPRDVPVNVAMPKPKVVERPAADRSG